MIDLDRLHNVIQGKVSGRQSGKTFADLCKIVGYSQSGYLNIVGIIQNWYHLDYLLPMLREITGELGVALYKKSHGKGIFSLGNTELRIFPVSRHENIDYKLRGLPRDTLVVYL